MNKALIIIDVQKHFLTKETQAIAKKISDHLKNNSQKYSAIYFTVFRNNSSSPLWKLSGWKDCVNLPDIDVCDEIKEFTNNENLFYKNILSAIKVPQIIQGIHKNKISEVHLCGFDTDCCVLATAYDLFDQGIRPIVLEDLTWSTSKEKLHNPAIQMLKRNIGFVEKTVR